MIMMEGDNMKVPTRTGLLQEGLCGRAEKGSEEGLTGLRRNETLRREAQVFEMKQSAGFSVEREAALESVVLAAPVNALKATELHTLKRRFQGL